MLVVVLLQFVCALAHASQGGNFMVAVDDVDGVIEDKLVLWAVVPGSVSQSFPLLDDGLNGDRLAGDGLFTGMVNELPAIPIHLSLQTESGYIWREPDFLYSGDLEYPALRLSFEGGVVTGELSADRPPEDLSEGETGSAKRFWIEVIGSFLVALLGLMGLKESVSRIRRRREAKQMKVDRGDHWALSQGLPVLRDGLQIWQSTVSGLELRKRILSQSELCGTLFWLPSGGIDGLESSQVTVWTGDRPSIGEIIYWRDCQFDPAFAGPLIIEGLDGVRSGGLSEIEWLVDLSEMTEGPVVVIIPEGELPPIAGLVQHRV
jgi:hypothetical protein